MIVVRGSWLVARGSWLVVRTQQCQTAGRRLQSHSRASPYGYTSSF